MQKAVLICTVGGSPQPVVTAIRTIAPEYVVFVCSEDDPATGAKGSHTMVEAKTADTIPAQSNLKRDAWEILYVPADDFEPAYRDIGTAIDRLTRDHPDHVVCADFTGGTKTMTAALMLAAIDRPNVRLQLVTGTRDTLQKVRDGSEYVVNQNVADVRLERAMRPFLEAWSRFAYDEAAEGLARLLPTASPNLRPVVQRSRDLSLGFAAWDRFDHAAARTKLIAYTGIHGDWLEPWLRALHTLAKPDREQREPLILLDLWRNAERRAAQGRFDDAVGRLYRLLEWTAQWLWRVRHQVSTDDFPAGRLPADLAGEVRPGRSGRIELGLWQSWILLARLDPEAPLSQLFAKERKAMLGHLEKRNDSLLAHGFAPIGADAWQDMAAWLEGNFMPMLREQMDATGCRLDVKQLPVCLPIEPGR